MRARNTPIPPFSQEGGRGDPPLTRLARLIYPVRLFPCRSLRSATPILHVYLFLASTQTSQPKSRWEEIRAEHARNIATRSSWDELRQNASRLRGDTDQPDRSQDPAAERLAEQQKFDAMLDAERQKAAEGMQGNSWESSI
jgi:hypothetical protein